jgi:hypothetical protein
VSPPKLANGLAVRHCSKPPMSGVVTDGKAVVDVAILRSA